MCFCDSCLEGLCLSTVEYHLVSFRRLWTHRRSGSILFSTFLLDRILYKRITQHLTWVRALSPRSYYLSPNLCAEKKNHRNISGSIHRSRANRLAELCLLTRSTDANTDRILLEDSSAGAGGALCRFGFTTRTTIIPTTMRNNSIIAFRLVVRRW